MTALGNKWRPLMWGGFALLVALPAIAMALGAEGVIWTASDFVFATVLFGLLGGAIELAMRSKRIGAYKWASVIACLMGFATIWINMAVGIIGSENNPLNAHYIYVVGIPIIGALVARFKPSGMALAMVATAIAHVVIAVIASASGYNIWPFALVFGFMHMVAAYFYRTAAVVRA